MTEALDEIAADAAEHDGVSTVYLLGRYRHLQPDNLAMLTRRYPRLEISYMTVHRSKGLEADYVVVLGVCSGTHGFPTEITDDPLLDLVLAAPERHPNAEERRLFYVAITRAKRRIFLLADSGPPSSFIVELIEGGYDITVFGQLPEEEVPCPTCVTGHLQRRTNSRNASAFFGCSNWPYCKYTSSPCPACAIGLPVEADGTIRCRDCGQTIDRCPRCDGWLRSRTSKHGPFLGCSNWPGCDYKQDIRKAAPPRRRAAK